MAGDGNFLSMGYGGKQFRKPVFGLKYGNGFHDLSLENYR